MKLKVFFCVLGLSVSAYPSGPESVKVQAILSGLTEARGDNLDNVRNRLDSFPGKQVVEAVVMEIRNNQHYRIGTALRSDAFSIFIHRYAWQFPSGFDAFILGLNESKVRVSSAYALSNKKTTFNKKQAIEALTARLADPTATDDFHAALISALLTYGVCEPGIFEFSKALFTNSRDRHSRKAGATGMMHCTTDYGSILHDFITADVTGRMVALWSLGQFLADTTERRFPSQHIPLARRFVLDNLINGETEALREAAIETILEVYGGEQFIKSGNKYVLNPELKATLEEAVKTEKSQQLKKKLLDGLTSYSSMSQELMQRFVERSKY